MAYLYLVLAIVAEVIGTTLLKASETFTRPLPATGALLGYAFAFYFLALTLRTISTGVAYAIWSGVGIVLISLAAWVFHGQKLDSAALAGMALIVAGVAVINLFSRVAGH